MPLARVTIRAQSKASRNKRRELVMIQWSLLRTVSNKSRALASPAVHAHVLCMPRGHQRCTASQASPVAPCSLCRGPASHTRPWLPWRSTPVACEHPLAVLGELPTSVRLVRQLPSTDTTKELGMTLQRNHQFKWSEIECRACHTRLRSFLGKTHTMRHLQINGQVDLAHASGNGRTSFQRCAPAYAGHTSRVAYLTDLILRHMLRSQRVGQPAWLRSNDHSNAGQDMLKSSFSDEPRLTPTPLHYG
jgi:hypothetical protein